MTLRRIETSSTDSRKRSESLTPTASCAAPSSMVVALATAPVNAWRKDGRRERTCKRGHLVAGENAIEYIDSTGVLRTRCRACGAVTRHTRRPLTRKERKDGDRRLCTKCHEWKSVVHFLYRDGREGYYTCAHCRKTRSKRAYASVRRDRDVEYGFAVKRIQNARDKGLSYAAIGELLGVNDMAVWRWMRGVRIRTATLKEILPVLLAHSAFDPKGETQ